MSYRNFNTQLNRTYSSSGSPQLSRNNSQSIDKQVSLERHQSIASVSSTNTVVNSGNLLDRLNFDDDLPWEKEDDKKPIDHRDLRMNLQQKRQPSGAGLNYARQQRLPQSQQPLSRVGSFINGGKADSSAADKDDHTTDNSGDNKRSSKFSSLRNSLRLGNKGKDSNDALDIAAQTAAALGSTVNQIENRVVVGHANINHQDYAQATLEMNEDEDEGNDEYGYAQPEVTPSLYSNMGVSSTQASDLPIKREDPNEIRVKKAAQLQKEGKPREAAYELSIAAHHGSKTAMLLYGIFLRVGHGLKKDAKQSFLWIARAAGYDLILNANSDYSVDPSKLTEEGIPKSAPEPEARAYYELGIAFLNGIGTEKDESRALQFLEKSASLGYVDAMTQAGMLWYKKGPHGRKKDLHRSAAWLRFADKKGADNVGTSWIYKDKYMRKK